LQRLSRSCEHSGRREVIAITFDPASPADLGWGSVPMYQCPPWWEILWKYSLFEAADSAWSLIVVSTYFGAFVQVVLQRPGAEFGWAVTVASLIVALASPLLGAAADISGRRQPYLRICVAAVTLFTMALTFVTAAWAAFGCFILAYICANVAFTFFTAMLPAVSNERSVCAVTSMTVGVGYLGGLICIFLFSGLAATDAEVPRVFVGMGLAYLAFALPVMFLSPDFPAYKGARPELRTAYRRILQTFHEAKKYRYLLRFLIGDFLYENAVASVITVMGLYSRNVMGFSATELKVIFAPAIVIAALSAWFVFGPLTKTIGPRRSVLVVLSIWLLLFAATIAFGPNSSFVFGPVAIGSRMLFVVIVAPLAGLGLAGVWSTSRVLLTALTPVEKSGEFWGLYNLSGRTASVLGDATWSTTLTLCGEGTFGYHIAILLLAGYVVLGAGFILTLPNARPSPENFLDRGRSSYVRPASAQ